MVGGFVEAGSARGRAWWPGLFESRQGPGRSGSGTSADQLRTAV